MENLLFPRYERGVLLRRGVKVLGVSEARVIGIQVDYTAANDSGELLDPSDCTFVPGGLGDVVGSKIVTSAWAFFAKVPRSCKLKMRAGLVEHNEISRSRSMIP